MTESSETKIMVRYLVFNDRRIPTKKENGEEISGFRATSPVPPSLSWYTVFHTGVSGGPVILTNYLLRHRSVNYVYIYHVTRSQRSSYFVWIIRY